MRGAFIVFLVLAFVAMVVSGIMVSERGGANVGAMQWVGTATRLAVLLTLAAVGLAFVGAWGRASSGGGGGSDVK